MSDERMNWDEFRWEAAFKKGDELAHLYFQLFEKYGDYPESQDVIERLVSEKYPDLTDYIESDFILADENPSLIESDVGTDLESEMVEDFQVMDANELCRLLKAASLGWCSINAALLDPKNRELGLKVLYNIGRALSIATCTIGDGLTSTMITAFLKRLLPLLNTSVGLIHQVTRNTPELSIVLETFIGQLSAVHDVVIELLFKSRSRI